MRTTRGFTLVETLVAIALLVILMVFILTMFSTTRQAMRLSENHTNAAFLGRMVLNEVYGAGFDNMVSTSKRTYSLQGVNEGNPWVMNFDYQVFVQADSVYNDKKTVWVTIEWQEKKDKKKVTVETVYVKPK
jgi:prepilin-type N-terminal cleavage/methylation domain-containing protein